MNRRNVITALGALAAASQLPTAFAQSYPDRPIRLLQGFAPGGNADNIARLVGGEMSKGLGQPVVVEPSPGAGGTICSPPGVMRWPARFARNFSTRPSTAST